MIVLKTGWLKTSFQNQLALYTILVPFFFLAPSYRHGNRDSTEKFIQIETWIKKNCNVLRN